jgi:hypothetical protein
MIYALGGEVEAKRVPSSTPNALFGFIKRLIVHDVLGRPNWDEDLVKTIQDVRQKDFGRKSSNMKPLTW